MLVRAGTHESAFGLADIVHVHSCQNGVCLGTRRRNSTKQWTPANQHVLFHPTLTLQGKAFEDRHWPLQRRPDMALIEG